jgi:hypothetical protein
VEQVQRCYPMHRHRLPILLSACVDSKNGRQLKQLCLGSIAMHDGWILNSFRFRVCTDACWTSKLLAPLTFQGFPDP